MPNWRPWGHQGVRRRWWRPTARCKQEKKQLCMSSNWTYSSKLCFLKKLPEFFLWRISVRIMGFHSTGPAVKNHIRNGKRIDCNIYNSERFVVPGLSASSSSTTPSPTSPSSSSQDSVFMSTDTPKIQYQKEVEVPVKSFGETRCKNPQTPKTKMENRKRYEEISRMNCLMGYRNSERIWLMKVLQQSLGETQSRRVKTVPNLLMNFQWSRELKWNRVRGSTV